MEHELSGGELFPRGCGLTAGWTTHAANVANPGRLKNVNAITWPSPSAAWAQPTHVGYYDASSGGNLLYYDTVDAAVAAPAIGATVTIGAEAFYIDLEID